MGKSGGLYARQRGNRAEYQVRDDMRNAGFQVDRIPASGASQGFKGDLRARIDGAEFTVEVKIRKDEFKILYEAIELYYTLDWVFGYKNVLISTKPTLLFSRHGTMALPIDPKLATLFKNCRKYLVNCDILAIKQNRKPILYMRWLDA